LKLSDEDVFEFVVGVDLPIVKYTLCSGESFMCQSKSAIAALGVMDRSLLNQFDYIFCEPSEEPNQLACRCFMRMALWAVGDFAPRVLVWDC
jgi:hypothetical protein